MKRAGKLMAAICGRENLAAAAHRAAKGKYDRDEVRVFFARLWPNLRQLGRELESGRYRPGRYRRFTIHDPKRRTIHAAPFRDRVAHHALLAVAGPVFDRRSIAESCACQLGKGNTTALSLAKRHTAAARCFLKLDIRQYFDSISHLVLAERLRTLFKDRVLLANFDAVLKSYETEPGRGLPIGALTSQYFANFYLDGLDRLVKERLGVRRYVRFMDDFVLWGDDRGSLDACLDQIAGWLARQRGLELKGSTVVQCCADGVSFLGYRLKDGRQLLGKHARRRFRRRLCEYRDAFERGDLHERALQRRLDAATAFVTAADGAGWRRRLLADFDF